jgi:PAS domain S-box-containing protein
MESPNNLPVSSTPRALWKRLCPAVLTIFIGIVLSVAAFHMARETQSQHLRDEFWRKTDAQQVELHSAVERYQEMLEFLRGLFLFSENVERAEFRGAVRDLMPRYPGIQAIEWVPLVESTDRSRYENAARADGLLDFTFRSRLPDGSLAPSPVRAEYLPIYYVEPLAGNEDSLGYDLAVGPSRVELRRARDTGRMALALHTAMASDGTQQYHAIFVLPVFWHQDLAERPTRERGRLRGYLLGVYRLPAMLGALWKQPLSSELDALLLDETESTPGTLLYHIQHDAGHHSYPPAQFTGEISREYRLDVAGRRWKILLRPSAEWLSRQQTWYPTTFLSGGLLLTAILGLFFHTVARRTDIVEREVRERTAALQTTQERLRLSLESAKMGIWDWDLASGKVSLSDGDARLFGLDPRKFDGSIEGLLRQVHPDDVLPLRQSMQRARASRLPFEVEYRTTLPDGSVRWLGNRGQFYYDGGSDPTRMLGVVLDITDHKRWEQALRESEERFRMVFLASRDGITLSSLADGRFVDVNEGFVALTGYARAETLGRTSLEMGLWCDPGDHPKLIQTLHEQGHASNLELQFRMKDGGSRFGLLSAEIVMLHGDKYVLSIVRDITERRQEQEQRLKLEQALYQAQKMESIGRLAGGVAHDFNNLLTVIQGSADLALAGTRPGEQVHSDLLIIRQTATRAARLTAQLLAFSRKQILEPRVLNLNEMLADAVKMLTRLIGEDIQVVLNPSPSLNLIKADPVQMEQVLLNLAVNARDAMPSGGTLRIETANLYWKPSASGVIADMSPGRYVMMTVADTGSGMTSEVKARIFEPFFTTKEFGSGTGLGLATVYGIIRQSGGQIAVDSEAGRGTTFRIYLPVFEDESKTGKDGTGEPASLAGTETILVVEDNMAALEVVERVLSGSGYRVLTAESAVAALELRIDSNVHLLLTDIVLPGLDGRDLSRKLLEKHPSLRVLFMSGYADDAIVHHGILDPGLFFIQKPFTPETLLRKVRQVLDEEQAVLSPVV